MIYKILIAGLLLLAAQALPAAFSWASQDQRNYLPPVYNQNNPHRCESGWAIATAAVLSTRVNIALAKAQFGSPSISLSAQSLLQCDSLNYGCLGGDPSQALRWVVRNNLTDSTCNSYTAKGYTNGATCSSQSRCRACWAKGSCHGQPRSKVYAFENIVTIGGEEAIANEILKAGPVVCGVSANPAFRAYSKGVLVDQSGTLNHDHYVMVYGWGEENGKKYWIIQNSYGPTWGESGSVRLLRGNNSLGIESLCYSASPIDTWTKDVRNETLPSGHSTFSDQPGTPLPTSVPLSASQSQLTPTYCEASWAFAVVHALSDGELARSKGLSVRSFSVQALLNCGVGSCEKGGNPHQALAFISKYGLPEEGCQHYQAVSPSKETCSAFDNCASCSGLSVLKQNCTEVKGYKRWKIYNYGSISGAAEMSRELVNHHAIICGIEATEAFRAYKGDSIFSETTALPKVNHWVEVVGEGPGFWLGRNSWGSAWGLNGFFKIKKGGSNLGIETKCYWAGDIS